MREKVVCGPFVKKLQTFPPPAVYIGMKQIQLKRPDQIKAYLDRHVVGQEEAKRTLAVAVYNHYKRILHKADPERSADVEKSNILLLGPTGCGKTLLVKTVAQLLGVPYYIGSATSITASGYVGDDVESLLSGLLMNSGYDVERARTGIVFIDEVDKIAKREAGVSVTRDVSGECVQQGLLKMVEGHRVGVQPMGGRKHPEQPLIYLDTTDILFIGAGAFVGLDGIVERRTGRSRDRIGFDSASGTADAVNPYAHVTAQDLRDYGLIPEFVGRFPIVTYVDPLDTPALESILTKPRNNLVSQYVELFREDGVTLTFDPGAISAAAQLATDTGTGARGLRSILEKAMRDLMFSAPKAATKGHLTILVTRDMILASAGSPAREGKTTAEAV